MYVKYISPVATVPPQNLMIPTLATWCIAYNYVFKPPKVRRG